MGMTQVYQSKGRDIGTCPENPWTLDTGKIINK